MSGLHVCRDSSTDTVLWLAHRQDVNMSGMLAAFTRPVKNQNAWRPVFGRLQLINSLVPLFGVSKGSEGGFQLEPLMKFVGSAFTSANAEVRSQAVKVTLLLYSKVIVTTTIISDDHAVDTSANSNDIHKSNSNIISCFPAHYDELVLCMASLDSLYINPCLLHEF